LSYIYKIKRISSGENGIYILPHPGEEKKKTVVMGWGCYFFNNGHAVPLLEGLGKP
jgi:hypothetical protein